MPRYHHYSFDLWLTLIKSDPAFKTGRTNYFHQHLNFSKKSVEEIALIFRQVDLMCNAINEKTGGNIDAEEMYLMVISKINDYNIPLQEIDIHGLYLEMEQLLMKHLPMVYCDHTVGVLQHLKQQEDTTTSLLSNTGFIKGTTLRRILSDLGIAGLLDFQFYSDEEGMSKPNKALYQRMIDKVHHHRGSELQLENILHVGDNPHADVAGAKAMGIHGLLINSNDLTIKSLLN